MRRRTLFVIVALLLLLVSAWIADRELKARRHPGLLAFMGQVLRNYPASFAIEPELLEIEVDDHELQQLEEVVEKARERGVIIQEGDRYVKADLVHDGSAFKARIRIKGKLSDHVEGSKWSFRVIARKEGGFMGMKRFSLQHPGTRNYLYEWFYQQLSRGEGLIALKYGFCKVRFNGQDLGVYAYEEHFGEELLEHAHRPEGPIVRFDPSLYWIHRLSNLEGIRFDEPYGEEAASVLDAYRTGSVLKDSTTRRAFEDAVAIMEGFRTGHSTASEVFDVHAMAVRHALLDLVGGHHSMDWSDVKFHFDPIARRFSPIAYESFSALPLHELAGSHRFRGGVLPEDGLHQRLFNDPVIFRAYVHALERISRTAWLDSAFQALGPAMDSASATIYREFPYKELDRSIYYRNQEVIRRSLSVPKLVHVFRAEQEAVKDSLVLLVQAINGLPVEVDGVVLPEGELLAPASPAIVPARPKGRTARPIRMVFPLNGLPCPDLADEFTLRARILGASQAAEVPVFRYTLQDLGAVDRSVTASGNIDRFPFLDRDDDAGVLRVRPGEWVLEEDLIVPEGLLFQITGPVHLQLRNGSRIVSRSPLDWAGSADRPVIITTDGSQAPLLLFRPGAASRIHDVELPGLITHHASVRASNVRGVVSWHSEGGRLELEQVGFVGGTDQYVARFANTSMLDCAFGGAKDDAVTIIGGEADLRDVSITGALGIALKAELGARVTASGVDIRRSDKGIEGATAASVKAAGAVRNCRLAVHAERDALRYGPVRIELERMELEGNEEDVRIGDGSAVFRDGDRVHGRKGPGGT